MNLGTNSDFGGFAPQSFAVIASDGTSLPVLATADDVREAVRLLKRKPEGITAVQASGAFRKRLFDPRKISAYEYWGIVSRDGDRLKLSPLGWEFADRFTPEVEAYRAVLKATMPYDASLIWTHEQKLEVVTHLDLGGFWKAQFPEALEGDNEENLESYAASFFHICHAAEIGVLTMGRKGQPTRLLVHPEELRTYLNKTFPHLEQGSIGSSVRENGGTPHVHRNRPLTWTNSVGPRVFISHSHNDTLVSRIQEALELADLESTVVERIADDATPISERAFQALRRCEAAIILITERDYRKDRAGRVVIDQNILVEVGAAFTHFDRRVLLLLESGMAPLPPKLQGILSCKFDGQDLIWDTAVQLLKIVKHFKHELKRNGQGSEH